MMSNIFLILVAFLRCHVALATEWTEAKSNEQPLNIKYAGPIVYSDEKPPVLFYPTPASTSWTPKEVNDKLNKGNVEYVPFPFQDLPVLIYKSNTTPPVHLIDESRVVKPSGFNFFDKRKGEQSEQLQQSQRTAKSIGDTWSKISVFANQQKAASAPPAFSASFSEAQSAPHLIYTGQPPIHVYQSPIIVKEKTGFGEQTAGSEKVTIRHRPGRGDLNMAAASNNYDDPAPPPSTATSTQYSYGSDSPPPSSSRDRERDRSRYGYRVPSSKTRNPSESDRYSGSGSSNSYDDYDGGYGSQTQDTAKYNEPYDNNLAPPPASSLNDDYRPSSQANDDYRSPPPQSGDDYRPSSSANDDYRPAPQQSNPAPPPVPPPVQTVQKFSDYEREPERPSRPRYPRYRYRNRYPAYQSSSSNSWNDGYNDYDSPSQSERSWLSSLFGGYNRWRPANKYRSPFSSAGSEISFAGLPMIDADSFNLLRSPTMPQFHAIRGPPPQGPWFGPRHPPPMAPNFRPALMGGFYGGFGQRPPPPPPPHSPYLAGSSMMPISIRPFSFAPPPMMGSSSVSYPVKVPYHLSILRPPFTGQLPIFPTRNLGQADMSFAESAKKISIANFNGGGRDRMVPSASQTLSTILTQTGKPVPNHLQKPPIIVYQGIKPPVHVYKAPQFSSKGPQVRSTAATYEEKTIQPLNEQMPSPIYVPSSTPSLQSNNNNVDDDMKMSESNQDNSRKWSQAVA